MKSHKGMIIDKALVDCVQEIFYESDRIVKKTKNPCIYPESGKHYLEKSLMILNIIGSVN